MKKILLISLWILWGTHLWAGGAPATHFNVYVAPNNTASGTPVALIVTAVSDSTLFVIKDDGMDGDTDDSHTGMLMAGQSYILYLKDHGVNDDAVGTAEGTQKADGDYFIIDADRLIYVSQVTTDTWQHTWLPATHPSGGGSQFILYTPAMPNGTADVNVFAYEDETFVTIRRISSQPSTGTTGYTLVNSDTTLEVVVTRTLNVGEDLLYFFSDGKDALSSGHTYVIESNKPITLQYGALQGQPRDGGSYVPARDGGGVDSVFYFAVPCQPGATQEIRILSLDADNEVTLTYYNGSEWIAVDHWRLGAQETAAWFGTTRHEAVYCVRGTAGKQLMVLEANGVETGTATPGDLATMVPAANTGGSVGNAFVVYMPPPTLQDQVINPFTAVPFGYATHAYLLAGDQQTTVTVKDLNTDGTVIQRTYVIAPGAYADCYLTQAEWETINNSGQPYLSITATDDIAVYIANADHHTMTYFGSTARPAFTQTSAASATAGAPGGSMQIQTTLINERDENIENARIQVAVSDGLVLSAVTLTNETTGQQYTGTVTSHRETGTAQGVFPAVRTLTANTRYTITSDVVVGIKYRGGTAIAKGDILATTVTTNGQLGTAYQQMVSYTGIGIEASAMPGMIFLRDNSFPWMAVATDSWTANWVDYDNDDDLDLFLPTYEKEKGNLLFRNLGHGQFEEVPAGDLSLPGASCIAATWADYDNDGDIDVALANTSTVASKVYLNDGAGNFKQVNLPLVDGHDHGCSWIDANNDGRLDLFTLDFLSPNVNNLYLYHQDSLIHQPASVLGQDAQRSIGASWADYDNDGWQDVFVPNGSTGGQGAVNFLYHNLGNGQFEKITTGDIATDKYNSVASTWGDYNNDGFMDLFVANASNLPNQLYKNNGDGTFTKQMSPPFSTDRGHSHGCSWLDYDNDGDLDLLVVNSGNQRPFLYSNNGDETFTSIPDDLVASVVLNARGLSVADFDFDGDEDIFITTHGEAVNHLFLNTGNDHHWLSVKLVGMVANRSAIGAMIRVKAMVNGTWTWQTRYVSSQNGLGGQNALNQHVGLGDATVVDSLVIRWPSGTYEYLTNVGVDQPLIIPEAEASTIRGRVYIDANQNCRYDAGESGVSGVAIAMGGQKVFTNNEGIYTLYVTPGNYVLTLAADEQWAATCSETLEVVMADEHTAAGGADFAVVPTTPEPLLEVSLGTTTLQSGAQSTLYLVYENSGGATAYNVTLTLQPDDYISLLAASLPWSSTSAGIYTWQLDSVVVGQRYVISINDSVSASAPAGVLTYTTATLADAHTAVGEEYTYTLVEPVVGVAAAATLTAYPTGVGSDHVITAWQVITYTVQFDIDDLETAGLVIEDILPEYMDMESLEVIAASHAYALQQEGHTLTFRITDRVQAGKGFIRFAVKPIATTPAGTILTNQATIRFQSQEAVSTNSVWHTVWQGSVSVNGGLEIFPNPVRDVTTIRIVPQEGMLGADRTIIGLQVYDMAGRLVYASPLENDGLVLHRGDFASGYYWVRVASAEGQVYGARMVVE